MQNPFTQAMSERTDQQLVDIVVLKREEYQPEALEAAEAELLRRNLDVNNFYSQEQVEELIATSTLPVEEQPLLLWHKIGIVVLPAIIITLLGFIFKALGQNAITKFINLPLTIFLMYGIHYRLKEENYLKMAKEYALWCSYTIIIYIVTLIVSALIIFFFFV